jgi:hypothetical protein
VFGWIQSHVLLLFKIEARTRAGLKILTIKVEALKQFTRTAKSFYHQSTLPTGFLFIGAETDYNIICLSVIQ